MNIIQIGANSGDDPAQEYINKNKDKLNNVIIVEPIPYLVPVLREKYSHIPQAHIENVGIVGSESSDALDFYYEKNSNYECSSFNKDHLPSLGCKPEYICVIKVPVMTFNQLMSKYGLLELDDLFIDAEGYDYQIITSIDFKKYKIKTITFEASHMDGTRSRGKNEEALKTLLMENGYIIFKHGENSVANLVMD